MGTAEIQLGRRTQAVLPAEQRVAGRIYAEQVDRVATPPGLSGQREGESSFRCKFQGGTPHELLQPLGRRIFFQPLGVDFFAHAGAGDVTAVDARPDCGGDSVPIEALEVGYLRFISACSRVGEGVVDPAFADDAQEAIPVHEVVVAEGIDHQSPRLPSFSGWGVGRVLETYRS